MVVLGGLGDFLGSGTHFGRNLKSLDTTQSDFTKIEKIHFFRNFWLKNEAFLGDFEAFLAVFESCGHKK